MIVIVGVSPAPVAVVVVVAMHPRTVVGVGMSFLSAPQRVFELLGYLIHGFELFDLL